jgi:hypothetical protein
MDRLPIANGFSAIQNNCEFRLFCSRHQAHAFSKPNPRKPAFPCIDPANCKTLFRTSRGRIGGLELPPKMVQQRMGYASIAITMDVYGHLFPRGDDGAELAAAEKALLPVAS